MQKIFSHILKVCLVNLAMVMLSCSAATQFIDSGNDGGVVKDPPIPEPSFPPPPAAEEPLEPGQISGEVNDLLNGYYSNPNWGDMVIRIDGENKFLGVYNYAEGTVTGTYDPSTGVVSGWWCEEPDRGEESGYAEFVFVADPSLNIDLRGKWTEGKTNEWIEDWDLTLIKNAQAPAFLTARFDQASTFCYE